MSWLKITFDERAGGEAQVTNYPRKRPAFKTVRGQWCVFDKDIGYCPGTFLPLPSAILFRAATIEACHAYIGEHSK